MTEPEGIPIDATASGATTSARADDLLVGALLASASLDTPAATEARITRAMEAIRAEQGATRARFSIGRWRLPMAAAAGVLILVAAVFLANPTPGNAETIVRQAIIAAQRTGDRRFEIRVQEASVEALPVDPIGTVDTRTNADGTLHRVVRMRGLMGHMVIAGRDGQGDWAIRAEDGRITRIGGDLAWPEWSEIGGVSMLSAPMDEVLEQVRSRFELQRLTPSPGPNGQRRLHLSSSQPKSPLEGRPARIDLWFDAGTRELEAIEVRWGEDQPSTTRPPGPETPAGRGRTGPPRAVRLDRVHDVAHEAGWFSPETHAR